ncbi:hypothetical protein CKO31_00950 [Thiohalocapsa halophila]|uniref:Cof-type HAD-IIB family hydrolase n=1 Tax=Thiohalocapsa halophila TaxID=69359 RepID=A0ABS1CC56_9GAMM|nr:HAD hydrolase family protein [Thiohalocapsa halophila]MBK1629323.1 hypothetical protein [Thiohalocapsa halophila]
MYKLVVSDLDGTLLRPDHRLGDYTRGVLAQLRACGVDLVLASGRHFMDIRILADSLASHTQEPGDAVRDGARGSGIPAATRPAAASAPGERGHLVSCNGAAVNTADGRLMQATRLPAESLDFLLRDPLFRNVQTNVFLTDAWLVEEPDPSLLRYHQDSGFHYQVADFAALDGTDVLKVIYHGEHRHLLALEAEILARHDGRLGTTFSLPQTLEVMAHGVSKGAALARLLDDLALTPADVVCFGDGLNDLEMLQLVANGGGLALLMDNADQRVHQALPDLPRIGSHADEAVAGYLARMLAQGGFEPA